MCHNNKIEEKLYFSLIVLEKLKMRDLEGGAIKLS